MPWIGDRGSGFGDRGSRIAGVAAAVMLVVGSPLGAQSAADDARSTIDDPRRASVGVIVLAHGGSSRWNKLVKETVNQAGLAEPTEIVLGMGMHPHEAQAIQQAVDALERRGVTRIVAVPFLVSSSSEVMRQFEYLLGLRAHGSWEAHVRPVARQVPVTLTAALDDDPVVAEVLLERARRLSVHPQRESVVLVAHGPMDEEDNARWLSVMDRLAVRLQQVGGFRAVLPVTMRDDAPKPVQEAASRRMRELVLAQGRDGRVLVIPLLLARGGVEGKIPARLKGLRFIYRGDTLLPHPKLAEWIAGRVREAEGPTASATAGAPVAHAGRL